MKDRTTTEKVPRFEAKIKLAILWLLVMVFALFQGTVRPVNLEPLAVIDPEGKRLLLFDCSEDKFFLAFQEGDGATVYGTDRLFDPLQLTDSPRELAVSGGKLWVLNAGDGLQTLTPLDAGLDMDAAAEYTQFFLAPLGSEEQCAFSSSGELYVAVQEGSFTTYYPGDETGAESSLDCIDYLAVSPGGWIYAYSNQILCRWKSGQEEEMERYSCLSPVKLLGDEAFVDESGSICLLEEGEIVPVLSGAAMDPDFCWGGEEGFYLSDGNSTVWKYSWEGKQEEACAVNGRVVAVAGPYILTMENGMFQIVEGVFSPVEEGPSPPATVEPEPSTDPTPTNEPTEEPSPSAGPSLEPSPTPDDGQPSPDILANAREPRIDGNFLMLPSGSTLTQVRELCGPEPVLVYTDGEVLVTGGKMKTGMMVENSITGQRLQIAIFGDCDGSGQVDREDVLLAQRCFLGATTFRTQAHWEAADVDNDGELRLVDLLLIVRLAEKDDNL